MPTSMPTITSAGQAIKVTPKPLGQEMWELASTDDHPVGIRFHSSWSKETKRHGSPRYMLKSESKDLQHALLIVTHLIPDERYLFAVNKRVEGLDEPHALYPEMHYHKLNRREDMPFTTRAYSMTPGIEFCLMGAEALVVMGAHHRLEWTTREQDIHHPGGAVLKDIAADGKGQLSAQLGYARVDVIPLDASGKCERLLGTAGTPEIVVPVNAAVALKVKDSPEMAVPICNHHRIILPEVHAAYLCAGAVYCVNAIPNAPMRQMGYPLLIRLSGLFAE